jgi:polyketide cyclase/dehydrase/lipid transport protein
MPFPLTVTHTFSTTASPAAVWRALESVDLWPKVLPTMAHATLEPPGALAAGSLIRTRAVPNSGAADLTYRVVAAEPPRHLMLVIEDEDYTARTGYRIVADGGETDIVVTSTLNPKGIAQSIRFLLWSARIAPALSTNVRDRMQALLRLAEESVSPG